MNKPTKPNITIPESFAANGVKADFDNNKILNGFDRIQPDVLAGDNLNKFIDDTYKGLNYGMAAADAINLINEGETLTVVDGKLTSGATGGGLEVCDIGMALYIDETKGLRRYLNGQIVDINTNTQKFLNRLLEIKSTNPEYFATENNWQSEAALNIDGCVYKFVLNYASDGKTVVSVRLPKYPDYVEINAGGTLPVVGNGLVLGLTGKLNNTTTRGYAGLGAYSGTGDLRGWETLYGKTNYSSATTNSVLTDGVGVTTDPSKSGIQTTLKQTKLKLCYFIQIATGSETENNIINEIELNNPYSLFDSKYSDHELNNLSWLKSEGQWNSKAVYTSAYDELLREYNNPDRLATFNKDAFTVVGSPTITDDGMFTANDKTENANFLKIPLNIDNANTLSFKFKYIAKKKDWNSAFVLLGGGNRTALGFLQLYHYTNSLNIRISFRNEDSTTDFKNLVFSQNINQEGEFNFYFNKNGNDYSIEILTPNGAILNNNFTETRPLSVPLDQYIGWANIVDCLIDLKQLSITVDGVKVFSGAKSKVKLSTDSDITDYDFVLNTADETFRLPLLDGSEDLPSDRYVDLELKASGSTYTAPANGWFFASVGASSDCFLSFTNGTNSETTVGKGGESDADITFKVKRGDKVIISYNGTYNKQLRFVYAQDNGSLYFYVGETVQNANLIDAGRIGEQLANKQDKCIHIIDTYVNGTSWYRVWSDGWCEQGGRQSINNNGVTVTYLKPFKDTNYSIVISQADAGSSRAEYYNTVKVNTKNATSFIAYCGQTEAPACDWHAFGYIN